MLDYDPNKKCLKCFKSNGFLFYCEDCGGTFCTDCIVSEKTECTFCNECSHISLGNKCEKCGKTNYLTSAKRYLRKCPNCTSVKIKDISKKIAGLPNEFVEAINSLNNGFNIIKDFATTFGEIMNEAKIVRRERFGLHPNIENNLIRIQGQFYEINHRASELLDNVTKQITQDAQLLSFTQPITISKLPQFDRVLKIIRTHTQSYSNLIEDFLSESKKDLFTVEEHLTEVKKYLALFEEVYEKLEADVLELKIAAIPKLKVTFPSKHRKHYGTLFLTNRNIYFLPKMKLLFKFTGKLKKISLSMIKDVEVKQRKFFHSKLLVNLSDKKQLKIYCTQDILERLNFFFGVLFNANEGFLISDPYLLEELKGNLDYNMLRERMERKIKDLKGIPFTRTAVQQHLWPQQPILADLPQEAENVKQIRIKLKAAKDTLLHLTQAFEDRSITPEIYFSRREKAQERIFLLEDELRETLKENFDLKHTYGFTSNQRGTR